MQEQQSCMHKAIADQSHATQPARKQTQQTLRNSLRSSDQTSTSVTATTLAERVDPNSSATSPNSHPGVLRILIVLPSTCIAMAAILHLYEHARKRARTRRMSRSSLLPLQVNCAHLLMAYACQCRSLCTKERPRLMHHLWNTAAGIDTRQFGPRDLTCRVLKTSE